MPQVFRYTYAGLKILLGYRVGQASALVGTGYPGPPCWAATADLAKSNVDLRLRQTWMAFTLHI